MSQASAAAKPGTPAFDFTSLFARDLPPPSARWGGFTKYHFIGGNNDADMVPVQLLSEAAATVLKREGRNLATYNLLTGPHGYLPLRQFLVGKLKRDAGIVCTPDDILLTSGSLQGLDLVNSVEPIADVRHGHQPPGADAIGVGLASGVRERWSACSRVSVQPR